LAAVHSPPRVGPAYARFWDPPLRRLELPRRELCGDAAVPCTLLRGDRRRAGGIRYRDQVTPRRLMQPRLMPATGRRLTASVGPLGVVLPSDRGRVARNDRIHG
jgi:hypothetical protein